MQALEILEWGNEHSLSGYPLMEKWEILDLLLDARFIQFDDFVPVWKSLSVTQTSAVFTVSSYFGDATCEIPKTTATDVDASLFSSSGIYIGRLVFGPGLAGLFRDYANYSSKLNLQFCPSTVLSIPTKAGVYSIAGQYGNVKINSGSATVDQTVFFDVNTPANQVTWNAAYLPLEQLAPALKTLNQKAPVNNNLIIQDSELLKLKPIGSGLEVALIGSAKASKISPSIQYEA